MRILFSISFLQTVKDNRFWLVLRLTKKYVSSKLQMLLIISFYQYYFLIIAARKRIFFLCLLRKRRGICINGNRLFIPLRSQDIINGIIKIYNLPLQLSQNWSMFRKDNEGNVPACKASDLSLRFRQLIAGVIKLFLLKDTNLFKLSGSGFKIYFL